MSGTGASHRYAFPSMGSTVELVLVGGDVPQALAAFALAEVLAAEWERTFSRFREDSELSRLNRSAGSAAFVSARLFSALSLAVDASVGSGGLFDPTVLDALVGLGYDRTFAQLAPDTGAAPACHPAPGITGIVLDPRRRLVRLPAETRVDLGGIAKGLYADEVARRLARWPGGVVSAGGDLAIWGAPPDGDAWRVGVENPADPDRDVAVLTVGGGVATSGTSRRAWRRGGKRLHHLIDPRTGGPAETGLGRVTVVAGSAAEAEVAATALFVGGLDDEHVARLRGGFARAVVVMETGAIHELGGTSALAA